MKMLYSWLKILHIVFISSWFAGLFYLPRIFVNMALENDTTSHQRLSLMAHKLYQFMHILAIPALGFGIALLIISHAQGGWVHIKLTLVVLIMIYHWYCGRLLQQLSQKQSTHNHIWFRWFNEIPVLLMLLITAVVVIKPFQN